MDQLQAERFESLKAGTISGLMTAIASAGLAIALSLGGGGDVTLLPFALAWSSLLSLAGASLSGFLFGVTYRYAVRRDQNPQLKAGVAMAFGLVRAIAQVEMGLGLNASPTTLALLAAESLILFTIAALVLDWAIAHQVIQPMTSGPDRDRAP